MARAFKINSVNGDGSAVAADKTIPFLVVDPATNKPFVGDDGQPSVVITLRPISQTKYRQICQEHTERLLNKKTRAMEEVTDWDAVQDALVAYAVQAWTGILGADDHPLQCVLDAKLGLPGDLKNEIVQRASQGEAVNPAASFRATA